MAVIAACKPYQKSCSKLNSNKAAGYTGKSGILQSEKYLNGGRVNPQKLAILT